MGEITNNNSSSAGIDLSQFYQVFFEEAGENLELMEQKLLELDVDAADDEEMNAIFRCAHSVKGGAATFGFSDVAALTHQMETLLDKLRRHEKVPTTPMVDTLLAAGDVLRALLSCHQAGGGEAPDSATLLQSLEAHAQAPGTGPLPATPAPTVATVSAAVPAPTGSRDLEILAGPLPAPTVADDLM